MSFIVAAYSRSDCLAYNKLKHFSLKWTYFLQISFLSTQGYLLNKPKLTPEISTIEFDEFITNKSLNNYSKALWWYSYVNYPWALILKLSFNNPVYSMGRYSKIDRKENEKKIGNKAETQEYSKHAIGRFKQKIKNWQLLPCPNRHAL